MTKQLQRRHVQDQNSLELERQVRAFLFEEARCIDEGRYQEWLDLWADDGIYWAPMAHDDPNQGLSLIYEDMTRLRDRVEVMLSNTAYPQEPASQTARVIANIELQEVHGDEVTACSVFMITERRRDAQHIYSGRYMHRLRNPAGGAGPMQIVQKKIHLLGACSPIGNLSFLL